MTQTHLTEEHLLQRRRELASKVADLATTLEAKRKTVASLGVVLRVHKETRADKKRKNLSDIRDQLFQAERELANFDEKHPGMQLMGLFHADEREEECQQQHWGPSRIGTKFYWDPFMAQVGKGDNPSFVNYPCH